jgi:hypothetical protein
MFKNKLSILILLLTNLPKVIMNIFGKILLALDFLLLKKILRLGDFHE